MVWPIPDIPEAAMPAPPRWKWWLAGGFAWLVLCAGSVAFIWPEVERFSVPWFWICAAFLPLVALGVVFSVRLHFFQVAQTKAADWNAQRVQALALWKRWAQQGLPVAAANVCLPNGLTLEDIAGFNGSLSPATAPQCLFADGTAEGALPVALDKLFGELPVLAQASALPLEVHVAASPGTPFHQDMVRQALQNVGQHKFSLDMIEPGSECRLIQEWLEKPAKRRLVVACQLAGADPNQEMKYSDSLCAVLFAPSATHGGNSGSDGLGLWRRPVPGSTASFSQDWRQLSSQNQLTAQAVGGLWQSGLTASKQGELLAEIMQPGEGEQIGDYSPQVFALDNLIGPVGPAGFWITPALASLFLQYGGGTQLVTHQGSGGGYLSLILPS